MRATVCPDSIATRSCQSLSLAQYLALSLSLALPACGGGGMAKRPDMAYAPEAAMAGDVDQDGIMDEVDAPDPEPEPEPSRDQYDRVRENDFLAVADEPLSTFSIDVDTASYSNTRRFLREGRLPPPGAVRIEELINYFSYDYPQPTAEMPFAVTAEVGPSPWTPGNQLVHIGLQGRHIAEDQLPPRNLVFLLDVSGSMDAPDKLGLLKKGFRLLTERLTEKDRVAIAVYAGAAGVVLPPTPGSDAGTILAALDQLQAGGSTNGGQGIQLAYALAAQNFRQDAINRVILATDGDFNVGTSDQSSLVRLVEEKRKTGVFLSVLGFGRGNLNDSMMEKLADHGNGNYAYIDSQAEARKVLVQEAGSTLVTIAKDVKIQVEFNPAEVGKYRLIGYENRMLKNRDFNDDTKDAGEIGAGHTVTAIYEIVPAGAKGAAEVDALKYQAERKPTNAAGSGELMTVKLRYKQPTSETSDLISLGIRGGARALDATSNNFRFSAAVAGFGMLLRKSQHAGNLDYQRVKELAAGAIGRDQNGWRKELVGLIDRAMALTGPVNNIAN